jgi:hypothetical protein
MVLAGTRPLARGLSSRALLSAEVCEASSLVALRWGDGLRRKFHPMWLRDNCPSHRHPGTRQRLVSAAELPASVRALKAEATADTLRVQWEPAYTSQFSAAWLRSHGCDSECAPPDVRRTDVAATVSAARASPAPAVTHVEFDELLHGGEAARWRWLRALAEDGATMIHGVPKDVPSSSQGGTSVDGVRFVAELIGPMQPNIYGVIFDVVSKGDAAENLAYTSEAIGPHMDLCYYESPPGDLAASADDASADASADAGVSLHAAMRVRAP